MQSAAGDLVQVRLLGAEGLTISVVAIGPTVGVKRERSITQDIVILKAAYSRMRRKIDRADTPSRENTRPVFWSAQPWFTWPT